MQADNTHSSNITMGSGGSGSSELGRSWMTRVKKANEYYRQWEQKSKSVQMEQYYECNQWEQQGSDYEPYVINLVFATIEIKLPTLLFSNPVFHVKPKPGGQGQYDIDTAVKKALLREDVLNTLVSADKEGFSSEIELAILDAYFRFGIIETGFSADWIDNPNAGKPVLRSDSTEVTDLHNNVVKQPERLPQNEQIYVRRIPAHTFRVGGLDGSRLDRCNWCGYYEFVRIEDLKANKALKDVDKLNWSGARSADFVEDDWMLDDTLLASGDLVKIWHIWDIRKKRRMVIADTNEIVFYDKPFNRLPLHNLRFHRKVKGWYPLPPCRNWKPMQDEQNEAKEQARNHRKRFNRKFVYDGSGLSSEEEVDKLINGGDGTFVKGTPGRDPLKAVAPVQNAQLGPEGLQLLQLTKSDFDIVAGSSNNERGENGKAGSTATEANIINQKASVRDSRQRTQVAQWLSAIGHEMLLLAEEKFTNPFFVKISPPTPEMGAFIQESTELWHQITAEELKSGDGSMDFEVGISLDSMSPIANDDEKNKFLSFLSVLNQFPEISMDPVLVRETAYLCGFRNEQFIKRSQYVAQMMMVMKMKQMEGSSGGAAGGPQPNQMAQAQVAQQTPNNSEQIRNQLQQQMTGPVQ